jgi:hypothetical protein
MTVGLGALRLRSARPQLDGSKAPATIGLATPFVCKTASMAIAPGLCVGRLLSRRRSLEFLRPGACSRVKKTGVCSRTRVPLRRRKLQYQLELPPVARSSHDFHVHVSGWVLRIVCWAVGV